MVTRREFANLFKKHKDLKFQFISTELDLAMTFCKRAFSAKDEATADRNAKNAVLAYQSAFKTLGDLSLEGRPEITAKLARVRKALPEVPQQYKEPKPASIK